MKTLADAIFESEKYTTKKETFDALSGLGPEDIKLVAECFNPYRVYGVRKYDWPQAFANTDPSYAQFFELLELLATRFLTGNAARLAVTGTLSQYTERTAKALARVLNKDLDCGANRNTFEKIYPDMNIPFYDVMLAKKIEERAEGKDALTAKILKEKYGLNLVRGVLAESKYDGNRLTAMVEGGDVKYYARSGLPSDYCAGCFDDELRQIEQYFGCPMAIDGEVKAKTFQETCEAKGSGKKDAKANLRFFAFDIMPLSVWKSREAAKAGVQTYRSDLLEKTINTLGLQKIIKSKYKVCYSIEELRAFNIEVLADGIDEDGTLNGLGEGLILKNMDGLYEWDRSTNWFKWKPVIDLDLKIVGWEFGKGRLSKTVGKLHLEGYDENGKHIVCKCGSGLNDKMRAYFLALGDKMIGMTVMIEAQEICLAQNATIYSARFPVFIRIRDDK